MFVALFHAIIFGNITAIIANLYAHSSKYRSRYSDLHEYIRMHEIKDPLKQRLLDHFHAVWLHKRGIETDEVTYPCYSQSISSTGFCYVLGVS